MSPTVDPLHSLEPGPTLVQRAYDTLLAAIREGHLPAGARLNQDSLAKRLHISRQPIGQALTVLRAQGFVRDTGRRGLVVAPLDAELVHAIHELREALDGLAARLAAGRRAPADLDEGRRWIGTPREFHLWLYRASGNALLGATMGLYWHHLARGGVRCARAEHEAILAAIAAGDEASAQALASRHVTAA